MQQEQRTEIDRTTNAEEVRISLYSGVNEYETRRSQHSQECKDPRRHCFWLPTLAFDLNGFPRLIFEYFWCVKFGNPSCIGF